MKKVFTAVYFFFSKKVDAVIMLGAIIYCGGMFLACIPCQVENIARKKKI